MVLIKMGRRATTRVRFLPWIRTSLCSKSGTSLYLSRCKQSTLFSRFDRQSGLLKPLLGAHGHQVTTHRQTMASAAFARRFLRSNDCPGSGEQEFQYANSTALAEARGAALLMARLWEWASVAAWR